MYVRLTVKVADAPRNTIPTVAINLHKVSLIPGVHTMIIPSKTPTMMQVMQIAKQTLFKVAVFMCCGPLEMECVRISPTRIRRKRTADITRN